MTFNPSAPSEKFVRELIPEGPHMAYCSRIIELGIQPGFKGAKSRPKAVIAFNLPGQTVEINGEPKHRMMSNPYGITLTTNEKSDMRKYANALNPSAKNLGEFLGKPCTVNVVHKLKSDGSGDKIDKIDYVTRPMAGVPTVAPDIDLWWFKFDDPDMNLWELIPQFQKDIILEAENYPGSKLQEKLEGVQLDTEEDGRDDVPF